MGIRDFINNLEEHREKLERGESFPPPSAKRCSGRPR